MNISFSSKGGIRALVFLMAVCLLLTAAAAQAGEPPERDYWPTQAWRSSTPGAEGMDETQLLKAIDYIISKNLDIRSLLVVKNGYIVFENYYAQGMPDKSATIHSATKSITSALIGIAHHQGILPDLNQGLDELLPEYFKDGVYPQKAGITLRHLLTMSGGAQPVKTKFKHRMMTWYTSPDRVQFFKELLMLYPPGSTFNYCNATSHLLSVILTKKSGQNTAEFAQKNLFDPLGIKPFFWPSDNQGYTHGSGGVQLTARQMAKFGFLYLNQGRWEGRQVIPKKWVAESTKAHIRCDRRYWYGYQWWVRPVAGHLSFRAWGHGGQFIVVVPGLDLVIVTTANTHWPGKYSGNFAQMFDIIAKSVVEP